MCKTWKWYWSSSSLSGLEHLLFCSASFSLYWKVSSESGCTVITDHHNFHAVKALLRSLSLEAVPKLHLIQNSASLLNGPLIHYWAQFKRSMQRASEGILEGRKYPQKATKTKQKSGFAVSSKELSCCAASLQPSEKVSEHTQHISRNHSFWSEATRWGELSHLDVPWDRWY